MGLSAYHVARDARELIADAPCPFTFDGSNYIGRKTEISKSIELEIGGSQDNLTLSLLVMLVDEAGNQVFVEAPQSGDIIAISSADYRVDSVETDPHAVTATITLITPHK